MGYQICGGVIIWCDPQKIFVQKFWREIVLYYEYLSVYIVKLCVRVKNLMFLSQ